MGWNRDASACAALSRSKLGETAVVDPHHEMLAVKAIARYQSCDDGTRSARLQKPCKCMDLTARIQAACARTRHETSTTVKVMAAATPMETRAKVKMVST